MKRRALIGRALAVLMVFACAFGLSDLAVRALSH
jgi:hypothetical protein